MLIWVVGVPMSVASYLQDVLDRKLVSNGFRFAVIGYEAAGFEPVEAAREYAFRFVDRLGEWIEDSISVSGEGALKNFLIFSFWKDATDQLHEKLGYSAVIVELDILRRSYFSISKAKELTNNLFGQLVAATMGLGKWANEMAVELGKTNSQPMLLPKRSFDNCELRKLLGSLCRTSHRQLVGTRPSEITARARGAASPHNDERTGRRYFSDARDRRFFTPGRALHGGESGVTKSMPHDTSCFVASFFRLGFPIGSGYHFDTSVKGGASFSVQLQNCHDQATECINVRYVNIYPSDFIRFAKK